MTSARGVSLHIGINGVDKSHYVDRKGKPWSGVLKVCEADAEDMAEIARSQGFKSPDGHWPTVLRSSEATITAVRDEIGRAAASLVGGDLFFLSYAGHGGQVRDYSGDEEEEDLLDETWVLYDRMMLDDELENLLAEFDPGVRILLITDSCHSRSVYKVGDSEESVCREDGSLRARFMPRTVARATFRKHQEEYEAYINCIPTDSEIEGHLLAISACRDNELAHEGRDNGVLTGTLLRVWDRGHFEGTYEEFVRAIKKSIPSKWRLRQHPDRRWVNPIERFRNQRPFTIVEET